MSRGERLGRIEVLVGSFLLLAACVLSILRYQEFRHIGEVERSRLQAQQRMASSLVTEKIVGTYALLRSLRETFSAAPELETSAYLRTIMPAARGIHSIEIADRDGIIIASSETSLAETEISRSERFRTSRSSRRPDILHLLPPVRTAQGGNALPLTIALSNPDGGFAGTLTAALDTESFHRMLSSTLDEPGTWAAAAHGDGLQFMRLPAADREPLVDLRSRPNGLFMRHIASGAAEGFYEGEIAALQDGLSRIVTIATIWPVALVPVDKPIVVAIGRSQAQIYSQWRAGNWQIGSTFAVILAITAIALWMHRRRLRGLEATLSVRDQSWREAERRFQLLVDGVHDHAIVMLDTAGQVASWNSGAARILGYAANDVIGRDFACFYTEEARAEGQPSRMLQQALATGVAAEEGWRVRQDGSRFWTSATIRPVYGDSRTLIGFAKVAQDITRRRSAQRELEAARKRLDAIMDNCVDGLITIDAEGVVQSFSKPAEAIFGYDAKMVLGRNISMLMPEPYRSAHDGYIGAYLRSNTPKIIGKGREVRGRRSDGTEFPMDLAVGEIPAIDGVRHFVGTVRDITERVAVQEQLRQALKMEVTGRLTGGLAHDFNNLLAVLIGNLEFILEDATDPRIHAASSEAMHAARRGADLIQRLLAFSRRMPLQPSIVEIDPLVGDVIQLFQRTLGETIRIEARLGAPGACALVDRPMLESALLNLAVNARDAMPNGGNLTVATSVLKGDDSGFVRLSVQDNGQGMTPEILSRAFEPFFTTKIVGEGSGLGLSMVYGFVQQSNGQVAIESSPGRGTTVSMQLPLKTGITPAHPLPWPTPCPKSVQERVILLVEDDPEVREVMEQRLRRLGYRVRSVPHGPAALEEIKRPGRMDVMLTDVVLPEGIDGVTLALEARRLRPDTVVICMSGYAGTDARVAEALAHGIELLAKPFDWKTLADALDRPANRA